MKKILKTIVMSLAFVILCTSCDMMIYPTTGTGYYYQTQPRVYYQPNYYYQQPNYYYQPNNNYYHQPNNNYYHHPNNGGYNNNHPCHRR